MPDTTIPPDPAPPTPPPEPESSADEATLARLVNAHHAPANELEVELGFQNDEPPGGAPWLYALAKAGEVKLTRPQSEAIAKRGFVNGVWGGKPNYQCLNCHHAYRTLDGIIEHRREESGMDLVAARAAGLVDAFGRPIGG